VHHPQTLCKCYLLTLPNLLVPGTQATSLRTAAGKRVYNAVRVNMGLTKTDLGKDPAQWVPLLSLEHTPGQLAPAKTTLQAGIVVEAGKVLRTPYESFSSGYEMYPYDWRCDIRHNAQELLDHLAEEKPSSGRWNVVGHSQGALVIVIASKMLDDPDRFDELVNKVVLLGSPLAGTMRAADALTVGSDDLGKNERVFSRQLARTWPSLYQMLPSWAAVVDAARNPLPPAQQLLQLGGYPDATGVTADILQRARDAHDLLREPLARMGGARVRTVLTSNKATEAQVVRKVVDGKDDFTGEIFEDGDSLVPYQRTLDWGDAAFTDSVVLVSGSVRAHAFLGIDEEVAAFIDTFIQSP
jgi:pimeloyl-ACP methyl ester carboxylesterase